MPAKYLINVTTFFRDEDMCGYLKKTLLPRIVKSNDQPKAYYNITVQDNGIGFRQEYAEQIAFWVSPLGTF